MAEPQEDNSERDDVAASREPGDDGGHRLVPELKKPPPNPRRALPVLVVPIVGMIVMTNLGNAFFPTLVEENPALLLALNSQNRYLALTTTKLDALPYFGIGMFRLLLPDPFFYLLGFWYGETVIRWIETKSQTYGLAIRQMEKLFDKASWLVVTVFPNNYVCLIAGTARMSPIIFAILDVIGTAGRLVLFRIFGEAFQEQIQSILDFIGKYRWQLTIVSFSLVALTLLRDWRAGRGQIEAIRDLEEEIESDYDAGGA
ncbi:MAG: hypothetical protein HYX32_07455 [Actinobacteria bacterium]|nr:hypothetical protein [Actinomycetota bacterium]